MNLGSKLRSIVILIKKKVFSTINDAIYNYGKKAMYLDGPGGSGKTFLYNALIHHVVGNGDTSFLCINRNCINVTI